MGPICGVYSKLRAGGATERVRVRQRMQEMLTSDSHELEAMMFCYKQIPVDHVSRGSTMKMPLCDQAFLEQHNCIINTLLMESELC